MKVVDSSIVLKWFVEEEGSAEAAALVGTPLIAPDLLLAELANALWKKHRRGEIGLAQARAALAETDEAIDLTPIGALAEAAFEISAELDHPVYDAFFVALAERLQCPLLTADARLAARLQSSRFASLVETLA